MLRSDIYSHIAEQLGEKYGTTGETTESDAYFKLVTDECDMVARKTRSYWQTSSFPLVANVAQYCAPEIVEAECVSVFTSDGKVHMVDTATMPAMDDWGGSAWRSQAAGAQPFTAIWQGLSNVVLSPAPNFNSLVYNYVDLALGTGGLLLSSAARPFVNAAAPAGDVGIYVNVAASSSSFTQAAGFTPGWYQIVSVDAFGVATLLTSAGTAGSVGGTAALTSGGLWVEGPGVPGSIWDATNASCPLVARAHMTVAWAASLRRCIPAKADEATYNRIKEAYLASLGQLERETRGITYASRVPAMVGSGYGGGAWDPVYGNPLDL